MFKVIFNYCLIVKLCKRNSIKMDSIDIDDYVLINKKILKLVGLYPVNVLLNFLCILCIFFIVVPQVMLIYYNWTNLSIVLEASSVLLTIVLAVLKLLLWISKKDTVDRFVKFMLTDYWNLMINNNNTDHLMIHVTYAKRITKGYLFLISNALVVFFGLPLIDILIAIIKGTVDRNLKHFPFVAFYPAFFYNFPFYEVTYISQMIATSTCGLVILAMDTLIATALFHTCNHFTVLQEKLNALDTNLRLADQCKLKMSKKFVKKIKLQLTHIVRHHQIVLWFCDNMEQIFSPILLVQTLASSLIICLVGLQVNSSGLAEKTKLIKYLSYLLMALFQLLLFCFPGDELIYQSSMISQTTYSIEWYRLPVFIKIEICMLMLRSQKSSYITAGKFYVMHLENFNAIVSTSLSYFMVLQSFSSETVEVEKEF